MGQAPQPNQGAQAPQRGGGAYRGRGNGRGRGRGRGRGTYSNYQPGNYQPGNQQYWAPQGQPVSNVTYYQPPPPPTPTPQPVQPVAQALGQQPQLQPPANAYYGSNTPTNFR